MSKTLQIGIFKTWLISKGLSLIFHSMAAIISLITKFLTICRSLLAFFKMISYQLLPFCFPSLGGAVAQSVECATPGQEVPCSIPAVAARSLLVGSVSV